MSCKRIVALLYDQNGNLVSTGFSPAMFMVGTSQTYTVQVDDYGSCHFDHSADSGSTNPQRVVSISADTQLTAVYDCGSSPSGVTVDSADQDGNAISGYYAALYDSSGSVVATGFTDATFATTAGQTYSLRADSFGSCTFSQWSDGVTSDPRTFTATAGALGFTAVYNCGVATSTINISTVNSAGSSITGYYITLWQNGIQLQTCFSTRSFTVHDGQTYQVTAASYGSETFSHWQNGANSAEAVNVPSTSTTIHLTALYSP